MKLVSSCQRDYLGIDKHANPALRSLCLPRNILSPQDPPLASVWLDHAILAVRGSAHPERVPYMSAYEGCLGHEGARTLWKPDSFVRVT